jgi:2-polyprenyl-6-hydroxyphenyl methylase/3-demethylubiquinone-9 3-methyltransferase
MTDGAELYDEHYYLKLPVDSGRIRTLLQHFDFRADDTVCEIGCAAGHFLTEIAGSIKSGIGIDTAAAAISAAGQRRQQLALDNIEFQQVSAQDYAGDREHVGQFDYVLLMDVTEHIGDAVLAEVLIAAGTLLKSGGRLVIHTPNLAYWLERLKDAGVVKQIHGHIAVRNEAGYLQLLNGAGFDRVNSVNLPHYRQPLRSLDLVLMRLPWIGHLFGARLFMVAQRAP